MDLSFEFGEPTAPCGHALIYFTSGAGDSVLATYVVIPPIHISLEKYVPPAFASLLKPGDVDLPSPPMPPVAEEVESVQWLRDMAELRRDDLVNAGTLYSVDLPNVVALTQEAAAQYAALYNARPRVPVSVPETAAGNPYADLSEAERLGELTKLVGRLRDSLGSSDAQEVEAELHLLANTLPSKYRMEELLEWAAEPGDRGQQLATLHIQRSYKLLNEDYLEVADIERRIRQIQET